MKGSGCSKCNSKKQHSKEATKWLETLIPTYPNLRYAKSNDGEYKIPKTRLMVDGFDKDSNTIFEYMGCFWHACRSPKCKSFQPGDTIHPGQKMTYQAVYDKTKKRIALLRAKKYNIIIRWGCGNVDNLE